MEIRPLRRWGQGHWLLARRSVSDPTDIAYYACFGPVDTSLAELVRVAGSRWAIEECFQTAKNETGLDHYQVRGYQAWCPAQHVVDDGAGVPGDHTANP